MSEFLDAEYEIESRLVRGLRAIFEKDEKFVYNKNQKESQLLITIDYPDSSEAVEKVPHIIISHITLQNNPQTTFGYNFYKDVEYNGIKNGAQQYAYVIPYSVTLTSSGQQNTSKDLASRLHWYLTFAGINYLSEKLGLQISNISKGDATPSRQYPDKIWDTPIQLSGTLYWIGTKGPEDALYDIDKPLTKVNIKFN